MSNSPIFIYGLDLTKGALSSKKKKKEKILTAGVVDVESRPLTFSEIPKVRTSKRENM